MSASSVDDATYVTASDSDDHDNDSAPCSPATGASVASESSSSAFTHLAELTDSLKKKKKKKKKKTKAAPTPGATLEAPNCVLMPDGTMSLVCKGCLGRQHLNRGMVTCLIRQRMTPQYCRQCVFGPKRLKNVRKRHVHVQCRCGDVFESRLGDVGLVDDTAVVPWCATCTTNRPGDRSYPSRRLQCRSSVHIQAAWRRHRVRIELVMLRCAKEAADRHRRRDRVATTLQCAVRAWQARRRRRALACVHALRRRAAHQSARHPPPPPPSPDVLQLPMPTAREPPRRMLDASDVAALVRQSVAAELADRDRAMHEHWRCQQQQWQHEQAIAYSEWCAAEHAAYARSSNYRLQFPLPGAARGGRR